MEDFFAKLRKLVDVKSIVTLTINIVLAVMVLKNLKLEENTFQLFSNIAMLVFGFYFGKQQSTNV